MKMSSLISFIVCVLCIQISAAETLYDKIFYKTTGPYYVSKEAVNWTEAKTKCRNADLQLASVTSEEEQETLKTILTEYKLIPEDKWSRGDVPQKYGKEDCVELKWDEIRLGWNDYFCDEARRYICEVPRKLKTKAVKKKLQQKELIQKEWQYKEVIDSDSTTAPETKENEFYTEPSIEGAFDYYWTGTAAPEIHQNEFYTEPAAAQYYWTGRPEDATEVLG